MWHVSHVSKLLNFRCPTDSFWGFLQFKLQDKTRQEKFYLLFLQQVFLSLLCQFRSNSNIQGQFCKLENKSFNLAPRLMGFYVLLVEILAPKVLTDFICSPLYLVSSDLKCINLCWQEYLDLPNVRALKYPSPLLACRRCISLPWWCLIEVLCLCVNNCQASVQYSVTKVTSITFSQQP